MDDESPTPAHKPIDAVICIDEGVYGRYRPVLRHLCVGLIDITATLRLLTSTAQAESLRLGPVQILQYRKLSWPLRARRFRQVVETLTSRPPTVVHAMSAASYDIAQRVAAEFDADIVYQVTALEDARALRHPRHEGPCRVICASEPLVDSCVEHTAIASDDIWLIRPGVICAKGPTCFLDESRAPTILTTADLTADGGVETLLHALHTLKSREHEFLAFLLGNGPAEFALRRVARDLGLGSAVVFAQPEGNVLSAMVGADIFVQPIVEKSISARSLEALGQGMAVVGVANGVHDAYLPEETAVVASAPTVTDLTAAIEGLLLDHGRARRLAASAIEYMRRHHTMTTMAELTGEVYRGLALARATIPMPSSKQP